MRVIIEKEEKTVEMTHAGDARSLLAALSILPETVLIVRDGELITEEDDVSDAGTIELLSVISGG